MDADVAFMWVLGSRIPPRVEHEAGRTSLLVVLAVCSRGCGDIAVPEVELGGARFALTASQWDYAVADPGLARKIGDGVRSALGGKADAALHVLFYRKRGAPRRAAYKLARIAVRHCGAGTVATFVRLGPTSYTIGCVNGVDAESRPVGTAHCFSAVRTVAERRTSRALVAGFFARGESVPDGWTAVASTLLDSSGGTELRLMRRTRRGETEEGERKEEATPYAPLSFDAYSFDARSAAPAETRDGEEIARVDGVHLFVFHNE